MAARAESPRRLVVEGSDDKHSLIHVAERNGLSLEGAGVWVHDAGSVEQAVEHIGLGVKTYERFGIVVDADDFPSRWQSIRTALSRAGVSLPAQDLAPDGLVVPGPRRDQKVGAWLMPDNRSSGALESFLEGLVPEGDSLWLHADSATRAASDLGARFPERDLPKARMHAWLAWQLHPGRPFGIAVQAGFLSRESELSRSLIAWLTRLFVA